MANETKKGLSTNSNTYTLIYSAVLVIIVAFLLSFVSSVLKERQSENEKMDKRIEILSAINISAEDVNEAYGKYVKRELIIDANGDIKSEEGGFDTDFNKKSDADNMPVYECNVDGSTKYVIPLKGNGLWGSIWGYVALESDKNTVYGIFFAHASETPGLGAEIVNKSFTSNFNGKHIKAGDKIVSIAVIKAGKETSVESQEKVDAISGATLTCTGVHDMLEKSLVNYTNFLTK